MLSSEIYNVYVGTSQASAIYLGSTRVWPPAFFWYGFNENSCVSINAVTSGLTVGSFVWGDGAISGVISGNITYRRAYGTGVC